MERIPKPNEIYKHFKGNLYKVLTLARHTETDEMLVIYQALYGDFAVYARPLSMFTSEVDRAKYPDAGQRYRFEKIPDPMEGSMAATEDRAEVNEDGFFAMDRREGGQAGAPAEEKNTARLMDFLDAETYEEKLDILASMHEGITDDMINTIAMALDLEVEEGETEDRYQSLKSCLLMLDKFECSRLR